MRVVDEKK